jgi:hypothetical protein
MNHYNCRRTTMELPPPVNPDVNAIADEAKYAFAVGTQLIASVQYRLGELAGTGRLDPEESFRIQEVLCGLWRVLEGGTLCAVRDYELDARSLLETDNAYSDGRAVKTTVRIEPLGDSDMNWKYDRFTLGLGAVAQVPRGEVTCIAMPDVFCGNQAANARAGNALWEHHYYEDFLEAASRLQEGGISFRPRVGGID